MIKQALGIFICCAIYCSGYAQDFRPGYYISYDKDSVKGFIKYESAFKMSSRIKFRKTSKSPVQELRPDSVYSFGFDSHETYVTKYFAKRRELRLVEKVIDGKVEFYEFEEDRNNFRYFVESDSLQITELTIVPVQIGNRTELITSYRSSLVSFFARASKNERKSPVNWDNLFQRIESSQFGRKGLGNVVLTYNNYYNDKFPVVNNLVTDRITNGIKVSVRLMAGYQWSTYSSTGTTAAGFSISSGLDSFNHGIVSFGALWKFPFVTGDNLSVNTELTLTPRSYSVGYIQGGTITTTDYTVNRLFLPLGLQYQFGAQSKLNPYVGAGGILKFGGLPEREVLTTSGFLIENQRMTTLSSQNFNYYFDAGLIVSTPSFFNVVINGRYQSDTLLGGRTTSGSFRITATSFAISTGLSINL